MNNGINVEEVKKFNETLNSYKDKESKLVAKLEFNRAELSKRCEALSKELGVEVNENNVEQIYNEYVAKIKQALETGNNILSKIQDAESRASQVTVETPVAGAVGSLDSYKQPVGVTNDSSAMPQFSNSSIFGQ